MKGTGSSQVHIQIQPVPTLYQTPLHRFLLSSTGSKYQAVLPEVQLLCENAQESLSVQFLTLLYFLSVYRELGNTF